VGAFDRIALQVSIEVLYAVVEYVEMFVVECKLRNILNKRTVAAIAVVVVVVVVVAAVAIADVVIVMVIDVVVDVVVVIDVRINQDVIRCGFKGFEKFLRDASR
jgi:hypothetical protein